MKCPDPDNYIDECPTDDLIYKWVSADYTTPLEPGQSASPPPPSADQSVGGGDCSGGGVPKVSNCYEAIIACSANTPDKINALLDKPFCGRNCGRNQEEVPFSGAFGVSVDRTTMCQMKAGFEPNNQFCCP